MTEYSFEEGGRSLSVTSELDFSAITGLASKNLSGEEAQCYLKRVPILVVELGKLPNYLHDVWARDRYDVFRRLPLVIIQIDVSRTKGSQLKEGYSAASVDVDEALAGKPIVHLHLDVLCLALAFPAKNESTYSFLESILSHEALHLLQYLQAYYTEYAVGIARLIPLDGTPLRDDMPADLEKLFLLERTILMNFINIICMEGPAYFLSELTRMQYGPAGFDKLLKDAEISAKSAAALVDQACISLAAFKKAPVNLTLEKAATLPQIQHLALAIGMHVAYTLACSPPKEPTVKKFLNPPPTLIKNYERAMKARQKKPVISYNSGKGFFDYNQSIHKLWLSKEGNQRKEGKKKWFEFWK